MNRDLSSSSHDSVQEPSRSGTSMEELERCIRERAQTIGLRQKTVDRYDVSLIKFYEWVQLTLGIDFVAQSITDKDTIIASYTLTCYDVDTEIIQNKGRPHGPHSAQLVLAATVRATAHKHFPLTRLILKKYADRHRLHSQPALPATLDQVLACVSFFLDRAHYSLESALAVCMQWTSMGRASEILGLHHNEVKFEDDRMTIVVIGSKTRYGADSIVAHAPGAQLASLPNTCSIMHLSSILYSKLNAHRYGTRQKSRAKTGRIFTLSYDRYRRKLSECFQHLELNTAAADENRATKHLKYSSHSFRRGKATALFAAGVPVGSVRICGRWTVERSLEIYLREGLACLCSRGSKVFEKHRKDGMFLAGF